MVIFEKNLLPVYSTQFTLMVDLKEASESLGEVKKLHRESETQ